MGEHKEMFDSIKLFRGLGVAAWMTLLLGILGCEYPFSTRTPEAPEKPRPYRLLSRSIAPGNVLINLKTVYDYALSADDYVDGLSEDFLFEPDPSDALVYEDAFSTPWDSERERTFTANLFDRILSDPEKTPRVLTRWEEIVADEEAEREAYFEYEYKLEFRDKQDESWKAAEGKAYFYLRKGEDENWTLSRWVDEKTNVDIPSWGALRAQF